MKKHIKYRALFRALSLLIIGFGGVCSIFLSIQALNAQEKSVAEYRNKATFLFNLTRFVYWPNAAFESKEEPFIIGIIGKDPFGQHLDKLVKGEKVDHRPIAIKRFKNLADLQKSHILYFNIAEASQTKEILDKTDSLHTLTVSDHKNFVKCGGEVVFLKEDNRIRIGINTEATKKSALQISSKLLSISKEMTTKEP